MLKRLSQHERLQLLLGEFEPMIRQAFLDAIADIRSRITMAEYALGWLGWSEDAALGADVNAIIVGMNGRAAMLRAMFGGEEPAAPAATTTARPLSPELFDALF